MDTEGSSAPAVVGQTYARSVEIGQLAKALAQAQGKMAGARKDAVNPHFRSSYADLESVWGACREPLSSEGLAVLQPVVSDGDTATVTTLLVHASGEWLSSALTLRPMKPDAQGIGGAITYARRYGLAAMVGVYQVDDDGETAVKGAESAPPRPAKKTAPSGPRGVFLTDERKQTLVDAAEAPPEEELKAWVAVIAKAQDTDQLASVRHFYNSAPHREALRQDIGDAYEAKRRELGGGA